MTVFLNRGLPFIPIEVPFYAASQSLPLVISLITHFMLREKEEPFYHVMRTLIKTTSWGWYKSLHTWPKFALD